MHLFDHIMLRLYVVRTCRSSRLELAAEKGPRKQAEESLVVSTAQLTDQRAELERYADNTAHT